MTQFKSDFLRTLGERGFIHQISDPEGLDALAARGPITGYIGFDATASSLHVGSLIQIMMLFWMQATGHRPIALMGGGTTMIGDPSGRDETRRILTREDIAQNIAGIRKSFSPFLDFDGGKALMANNADWLLELNLVDFLRTVGPHFSINQMIQRDSVKMRLEREQHLSFLEFNYMVFQSYDFLELNRRYDCVLQMGGSDQWGNIVSGVELGRRVDDASLFALTTPLLATASGAKMGKTAAGAVWLDPERLSPYDYWQFWRNTEDADVEKFLKLFTTLPLAEIAGIASGDINEAKKALATEATALLHGRVAADQAAETARATFEQGALDLSLPTVEISRADLGAGIGVLAAFVMAGLAASNGEARRHLKAGALKANDETVDDERATLTPAQLLPEGVIKLSVGKKKHALLKPV
ncbi:MAG: tyrosine--tRNA ligase [Alphaproteobacteria bacterium]|nr:tyrosine--tRNA ligase [Alphaproteobacteria bacterium]